MNNLYILTNLILSKLIFCIYYKNEELSEKSKQEEEWVFSLDNLAEQDFSSSLRTNKVYYNSDQRIYGNDTRYNRPYQEEKKVYNVFNYNQENDNAINNINDKNKYADIDKLIENSEKNFFKTQKLLEDYEKK